MKTVKAVLLLAAVLSIASFPAGAQEGGKAQACRSRFDVVASWPAIQARASDSATSDIGGAPGGQLAQLQGAALSYLTCKAAESRATASCSLASKIAGAGEQREFGGMSAQRNCEKRIGEMLMWIDADRGRPYTPADATGAAKLSTSGGQAFYSALSAAWGRRDPAFCSSLRNHMSAGASKQCAVYAKQWMAKTFKVREGQKRHDVVEQYIRHHLWNRVKSDCNDIPHDTFSMAGEPFEHGVCFAAVGDGGCEALLEPLKAYHCGAQ